MVIVQFMASRNKIYDPIGPLKATFLKDRSDLKYSYSYRFFKMLWRFVTLGRKPT